MNLDLEADRQQALTVVCPTCTQPVGEVCVRIVDRKPLENLPGHNKRLVKAGVVHAPLDSRDLRRDPDRGARW